MMESAGNVYKLCWGYFLERVFVSTIGGIKIISKPFQVAQVLNQYHTPL